MRPPLGFTRPGELLLYLFLFFSSSQAVAASLSSLSAPLFVRHVTTNPFCVILLDRRVKTRASSLTRPLSLSLRLSLLPLYSNYFLANAVLELILTTTCALVYGVLTYFLCFYASSGDFAFDWGKFQIVHAEGRARVEKDIVIK